MLIGYKQFTSSGTFTWPVGVSYAIVKIRGSGASGGSSAWTQLAGGGGSGAYMECVVYPPASGVSTVVVDPGGAALPANARDGAGNPRNGNPGGTTSFDSFLCTGAGGGQHAPASNTGGDGGTPGIAAAPAWVPGVSSGYTIWIPGGQGGASAPVDSRGLNLAMPAGANAPMGGIGGNNGQNGIWPGAGGAPGNNVFPSGAGGRGQVDIELYA